MSDNRLSGLGAWACTDERDRLTDTTATCNGSCTTNGIEANIATSGQPDARNRSLQAQDAPAFQAITRRNESFVGASACESLMTGCLPIQILERTRPLLDTAVPVRGDTDNLQAEHRAVDAALAAMARMHALMRFQAAQSDITQIHRAPRGACVIVDPQATAVLRTARACSGWIDDGCDITVESQWLGRVVLQPPTSTAADRDACSRHIGLSETSRIRLRRPCGST